MSISSNTFSLAGAAVIAPCPADATAQLAARELARFLYRLSGQASVVGTTLPDGETPVVVLNQELALSLGCVGDPVAMGPQGYSLQVAVHGGRPLLVILATTSRGLLYGVYGLLERLGMGFYAGGETYPERPAPLTLPCDLTVTACPAFAMRGNMLHYNFLCGCTDWGLSDYQFYFDQLARMRCNVLLMHWYDGEPGAAYQYHGEYLAGGVTPNSLTKPWGALASLRTSQFSFDTGRFFDSEIYTSPAGEGFPDLLSEIKATERMWAESVSYARTAGIDIAAGFEEPRGDPTDPAVCDRFRARLEQFLERNPDISHFALWQHESGACYGSTPPAAGTAASRLLEDYRELFAHLGNDRRIWEAVRYGRFAEIAADFLARNAPHLKMTVVGWGGDRWMRFSDLCLGYDRLLPPNVSFTCHDNIDASFGPNVSSGWGELPAARERWAMPWVEGDIEECWVRQPHVESLGKLAPDALAKGCQGLLTLQWRTRDVEEETGFIARYAWDTSLTPDRFYADLAEHAFGTDHRQDMGEVIGDLQRLGARWTGVRGCSECGRMQWTGHVPHFPFEVDGAAATYLGVMAAAAADALATVPPEELNPEAGAFHERTLGADSDEVSLDRSRLGVAELARAASRLEALATETDAECLREQFREIEEELWPLRTRLVSRGMSSLAYGGLDMFLIALHHVQRNAGATENQAILRLLRADTANVRSEMAVAGRTGRLERLDYLIATMDFALGFDAAAMLLADGEPVDQALVDADQAAAAGDAEAAAETATAAYQALVNAGLQQAVEAFTGKLTTRCDFGTLTTINVKALPLYWDAIERLEAHLPATPPRSVIARGQQDEVWLSWPPVARAAALHVYRRALDSAGDWVLISKSPLAASCTLFLDQGVAAGAYAYAVTAEAENGWESPRSHSGTAEVGSECGLPVIVGCKPPARVATDAVLPVRATVVSDRGVAGVSLLIRQSGTTVWERRPMTHRFRNSYGLDLDAAGLPGKSIDYCVEAVDCSGGRTVWPAATEVGLAWSVEVL